MSLTDLQVLIILFWTLCGGLIAILLACAVRWHGARLWEKFLRSAATNPYAPRATLLRSADGSITLARLASGQLRSLKRKPRGKSARKVWRRLARDLRRATTPATP